MNDTIVADASAILALMKNEPITKLDRRHLFRATISAVNLTEVLTKLHDDGLNHAEVAEAAAVLDLRVIAFDRDQASAAAAMRSETRQAGLSLGDRACLALGKKMRCPVATADRVWASVDVGVEVILIR